MILKFLYIAAIISTCLASGYGEGDSSTVYKAATQINVPDTDPVLAQKEEKIRQIMRDSHQDNYVLFNREDSKQKADLVYENSKRVEFWDKIIQIRRENARLKLFKISQELTLLEILLAILMVCAVVWVILFLAKKLSAVKDYIDDLLLDALLSVTSDLLIISLVLTVFNIIALYNLMITLQISINIEQISVAGVSLIFVWLASGVVKVWMIQLKVNDWHEKEAKIEGLTDCLREYGRLKKLSNEGSALDKEQKDRLDDLANIVEYHNLRDDFINPSYLPAMAEHRYRQDFPFSDYLTIGTATCLKQYMKFDPFSYVVLVGILVFIISCVLTKSHHTMATLPMFVNLICAAIICLARIHMVYIIRQYTGNMKYEEIIEFTQASRPDGLRIMAIPPFMSDREDTSTTIFGSQNLQERMFLLRNPKVTLSFVKYSEFAIVSLAIVTSPVCFYFWTYSQAHFWPFVLIQLSCLILSVVVTPGFIYNYSTATNIIMLRNKQFAKQAIDHQKSYLHESYRSVYRALKLLRRQTGLNTDLEYVKNSMHPLHKSQLTTLFQKISQSDNPSNAQLPSDRFKLMGIRDLGHLLGQPVSEDSWAIFAQECVGHGEQDEMVLSDRLVNCLEKMYDDTKIDPYHIAKEVIVDASYKDEFVDSTLTVDLLAFSKYLLKHKLLDNDMRDIVMADLSLLATSPTQGLNLDQMVSHMRNMVEGFAR